MCALSEYVGGVHVCSDSILLTIKKLIGMDENYNAFDVDIIIAINGSFMILNQLGVGPDAPFSITGSEETWRDFSETIGQNELVKNYIYLRTKLLFDPPTTGVLHEAIERQIAEFEFRLMVQSKNKGGDKDDTVCRRRP